MGIECKVIYTDGDADLDIAKIDFRESLMKKTVVMGGDTDLFILMLYYATSNAYSLHFRIDKSNRVHDITLFKAKTENEL